MDIPDVELVIVYGIPDTMSQLYQVLQKILYVHYIISMFDSQLCGRAGRDGKKSRDTEKISDPTLKAFWTNKENCLRSRLIQAVGGSVQQEQEQT